MKRGVIKKFRYFFAFIFILSLFSGIVHELNNTHHEGEVCEICVFLHAPSLLNDASVSISIPQITQSFNSFVIVHSFFQTIFPRTRYPPFC